MPIECYYLNKEDIYFEYFPSNDDLIQLFVHMPLGITAVYMYEINVERPRKCCNKIPMAWIVITENKKLNKCGCVCPKAKAIHNTVCPQRRRWLIMCGEYQRCVYCRRKNGAWTDECRCTCHMPVINKFRVYHNGRVMKNGISCRVKINHQK